jgi:predicted HAD superfamily Cof-like phosphohydrolase
MLNAMGAAGHQIHEDAEFFKKKCAGIAPQGVDRQELLDALCDQIVTAVGVAHMFGMDIESALNEVNASNWSKFVDGNPVFNEHGKIAKGPGYFEPKIAEFAK